MTIEEFKRGDPTAGKRMGKSDFSVFLDFSRGWEVEEAIEKGLT